MHSQLVCSGSAVVAARRMRRILGSVLGREGWRNHEVRLINTNSGKVIQTTRNTSQIGFHLETAGLELHVLSC